MGAVADYLQFHRPRLRGLIEVGIVIRFVQEVHQRLCSPYGFALFFCRCIMDGTGGGRGGHSPIPASAPRSSPILV
ncbi:hypothetical protein BBC27_00900 [Acidithiobacillus ferrivorans]|uniref:Uncharacterized protein n=1 Tax=Acidithiobacillus ferrivorans TaxID=160808 RepID=A0A1B9BWC1_9PROT|nr:hypothetical protein BBC27_00900 [Acidithiobacillus ferrivorans]